MLTGKLVRVRTLKNKLVPLYLEPDDGAWLRTAQQLLAVYRDSSGRTRGEVEAELGELAGEGPGQLVQQGLAKLLEDRCDFEVTSDLPPDVVREATFRTAAIRRAEWVKSKTPFDRLAVLQDVSTALGFSVELVEKALFADLYDEQRILKFDNCTAGQLLDRYNVALAQAVLLRCTGLEARVWNESPARFRQLFRALKFHRLIATVRPADGGSYVLKLDGPLSLFSSTQKYGLQLAMFLPTLLLCKTFDLSADILWGKEKKPRVFTLSAADGLRSHLGDFGMHVPAELRTLLANLAANPGDWAISEDPHPIPLDGATWVPDFLLTHTRKKKQVHVELVGFWRKAKVEQLYQRLKKAVPKQFVLIVSDQFRGDEGDEWASGPEVYRYKRTPIAAEVLKTAAAVAGV